MKKPIVYLLLLFILQSQSQNKQLLYNFAEIPQTLLLNPALENQFKFHIGVPLFSGFSASIGSSSIQLTDLFLDDGRNINDKISSLIYATSSRDFITSNVQIDVFSVGFRLKNNDYLNFGFYQELDVIGYFPRDFLLFFNEGNAAHINRPFNANHIRYQLDYLGVLHAGISRKINEKLSFGGRFKIYSSAINLQSNNNTGTFTTIQGENSVYRHIFNNVDVNILSSGLIQDDEYIDNLNTHVNNTFFGSNSNLGLGFDFGMNYQISNQLEFSASILDVGFINYKNNNKNTRIHGDFVFDGVNFEFDPNSTTDYWNQINERFKEQLPNIEDKESYVLWRPIKLNAALRYSFGEQRRLLCYDDTIKNFFNNAIGVQLFNVFRPLGPQLALTGFYEKIFSSNFQTKLTYTIDSFSYTNLGFGISTQISRVHFYALIDNLLEFHNLSSANSISFQLGLNLRFY